MLRTSHYQPFDFQTSGARVGYTTPEHFGTGEHRTRRQPVWPR
jgi:hypothetical protein